MKNLKMFAIAVMAFAVMAIGVRAETCNDDGDVVAARYNGKDHCNATVTEAISEAEAEDATELTVTLLDDVTEGAMTIDTLKSLTVKLNGHDWALGTNSITVAKGVTVEIQGKGDMSGNATDSMVTLALGGTFKTSGTIDISAGNNFVKITGGTTGSSVATLEIGEGANVTAKTGITTDASSNHISAKINGTWTTTGNVVKVAGGTNVAGKIADITINGTLESSGAAAISISDYANVTLNANVTGAAVGSGGAINVGPKTVGSVTTAGPTITITGGKYVTKASTSTKVSAVIISDDATDTVLKISCGEFTASKAGQAAIHFGVAATVENNKGNITGGTFNYGLYSLTSAATSELTVEEAIKLLSGTESFTIGEDKTVTLACGTQNPSGEPGSTEPGQQPGTTEPGDQTTGDGNQGGTDNVKNPNTNDNILVYAGLGLVSLTSVAFTARKRED